MSIFEQSWCNATSDDYIRTKRLQCVRHARLTPNFPKSPPPTLVTCDVVNERAAKQSQSNKIEGTHHVEFPSEPPGACSARYTLLQKVANETLANIFLNLFASSKRK